MEEVEIGGRAMTIAGCPKCDSIMTRAGGIEVRRERHRGLAERKLVFEPPTHAYCFSCKRQVSMIWVKAARYSDSQPRPSYRGNCVQVPGDGRHALAAHEARGGEGEDAGEAGCEGAKQAEDALYERRMAVAERRHREEAEVEVRREAERFQDAMTQLRRQYRVA